MTLPSLSVSGEAASSVCVAHLVRCLNGVEPLRRFLAAYRRHPGGLEHDLLLLCKGFEGGRLPADYLEVLADQPHSTLFLDDGGFDIVPYFAAAQSTDYAVYCFLNSFSEPLDPDWLSKLHACLQSPGVALVGATASWGSVLSYARLLIGRSNAYDGLIDPAGPDAPSGDPRKRYGPLLEPVRRLKWHAIHLREYWQFRRRFGAFPAYHIRSNAFMLRRETMLRTRRGEIRTKSDALAFESGSHSLTAQVLAHGERPLLVGRDGVGYEKERWSESGTFWQGEQSNLLVADNQTLAYASAVEGRRRYYAYYAWGRAAA